MCGWEMRERPACVCASVFVCVCLCMRVGTINWKKPLIALNESCRG